MAEQDKGPCGSQSQVSLPAPKMPPPSLWPQSQHFPYAAFPQPQGLRISSFLEGRETKKKFASGVEHGSLLQAKAETCEIVGAWQDGLWVLEALAAGCGRVEEGLGLAAPPCPRTCLGSLLLTKSDPYVGHSFCIWLDWKLSGLEAPTGLLGSP